MMFQGDECMIGEPLPKAHAWLTAFSGAAENTQSMYWHLATTPSFYKEGQLSVCTLSECSNHPAGRRIRGRSCKLQRLPRRRGQERLPACGKGHQPVCSKVTVFHRLQSLGHGLLIKPQNSIFLTSSITA